MPFISDEDYSNLIEFKRGKDKKKRKRRSKNGMSNAKKVAAVAGLGATALAAKRYGGQAISSTKNFRASGATKVQAARGAASQAARLAKMDAMNAPGAAVRAAKSAPGAAKRAGGRVVKGVRGVPGKVRREVDVRKAERRIRRGQ